MAPTHPTLLTIARRTILLTFVIFTGACLAAGVLWAAGQSTRPAYAAPIDPPEGFPKLSLSSKTVMPTVLGINSATPLYYEIEIRNTGAYTAFDARLSDLIPAHTTYNDDASASSGLVDVDAGELSWTGDVDFDSTVIISFSVDVAGGYSGLISNTAVISHPLISQPVTLTANAVVTDQPIFEIEKTSSPAKPGPGKDLTYYLKVTNRGQPANNLDITVSDVVPLSTTVGSLGADGDTDGAVVTWTRQVNLNYGESEVFTFTVAVDDVADGTVIANQLYQVDSSQSETAAGEVYTVTIVYPEFSIWKTHTPDPPGSNREMTYIISVFNSGSLATNLVITDRVPAGVNYVTGGSMAGGIVEWTLPSLDTNETAEFTYTVAIPDVAEVPIVNDDYAVCSSEGVCQAGEVITSVVEGPTFEVGAWLDPIAKGPGGGNKPVTPTLTLRNLGPGNAINAQATLIFRRISVSANDLYAIPAIGTPAPFPSGPDCGDKCVSYVWIGSLDVGDVVTFTTIDGQNSVGGAEGTNYTATLVVTDSLANIVTEPVTGTFIGHVTHFANLIPTKSAPPTVGRGELMTYTINVWNSGLSTVEPPYPTLTETIPASVTLVSVSGNGVTSTVDGQTVISWTLPAMSTGDSLDYTFTVRVDNDLVSGTLLVNDLYGTRWFTSTNVLTSALSHTGEAITTTVIEAGLIDSFKTVEPQLLPPGPSNVLTYYLHIVNSGSMALSGVKVFDAMPWEHTTYQRDAVASAGTIISDIVSLEWTGNVAPFSSEVVTFTVLVDPYYQGTITNTAVITHPHFLQAVNLNAVAYITTQPVLKITKTASPNPVPRGKELEYRITVTNLGQLATDVVISDTLPSNVAFVPGSASSGVQVTNNKLTMLIPSLKTGKSVTMSFRVSITRGKEVINANYSVTCAEGIQVFGKPVITPITGDTYIYLPLIRR